MTGSTSARTDRVAALASPRDVAGLGVLAGVQVLLVAAYFAATAAEPTSLRYVLYPVVWISVGVWAIVRTGAPSADLRGRLVAGAIAAGYLLALAWVGGLVAVGPTSGPTGRTGVRVVAASPGWGPTVQYVGDAVRLVLVPYLLVGYLALAYLVYAALLDAAGAALSGVLGLASCVSCSLPVVASIAAAVAGGSSGIVTAAYALSLELSTVAFLAAIGLLYWRPFVGRSS